MEGIINSILWDVAVSMIVVESLELFVVVLPLSVLLFLQLLQFLSVRGVFLLFRAQWRKRGILVCLNGVVVHTFFLCFDVRGGSW